MGASKQNSPPAEITSRNREDAADAQDQEAEETSQKSHEGAPREEEEEGEEEDEEEGEARESDSEPDEENAPPLPDEVPPPLPNEAPPGQDRDDGWEPVWDAHAQAYYFYNRFTGVSQWENPRVPPADSGDGAPVPPAPGTEKREKAPAPLGGYNPAIHGDYDPTAPYAQQYERQEEEPQLPSGPPAVVDPNDYDAVGSFNRFTGRWQGHGPEYYNDENKSKRQMGAYFDVDAAANAHDGRSLRAERSAKKLSKKELKMFRDKRREKKEEKRRAWLRD